MRIAFHGKGGAGKTTTAAGFVEHASRHFPFVLAVDADLNCHLKDSLGLAGTQLELAKCFDDIMNYLKGDRTDIAGRTLLATLPPSRQSNFVRPIAHDPFISKYGLFADNVGLLSVGGYENRDISSTCYHEKLKALMAVMHHLLDSSTELVVVDTIAGTDNISTSLSFAFDLNVFVVEPTIKSVRVYQDYAALVPQYAERLRVIANKVADDDDLAFIQANVPAERLVGVIPHSVSLKRFEQARGHLSDFRNMQAGCFARLIEIVRSRSERDWTQYLRLLRQSYQWDCSRWYSEFYKCDLLSGVDDTFTYESVLQSRPAECFVSV